MTEESFDRLVVCIGVACLGNTIYLNAATDRIVSRSFILSYTVPMKDLTRTICLTLAVLLGSLVTGCGADYQKGLAAAESGDFATALREWKPLAEQGHVDAQLNLGRMYYIGQGVPQDEKTAGKWITLAAEQGHVSAQAILSTMYASGGGVIADNVYAHMWGSIAVSRGLPAEIHSLIMTLMPVVAKEMTPAQIEKAEKLASECIRKKYKGC